MFDNDLQSLSDAVLVGAMKDAAREEARAAARRLAAIAELVHRRFAAVGMTPNPLLAELVDAGGITAV